MIVGYYEADIPKRSYSRTHIEVGSSGIHVSLLVRQKCRDEVRVELTVAETKKLIEGLLDTTQGCNMTLAQRNRFCRALELRPEAKRKTTRAKN